MTLLHRRAFLHFASGATALIAIPEVATALDYPTRPVRMIVGLAAGGPTDSVARLIAQWLSEHMGNQFAVENRTGAGGALTAKRVVNATANESTFLLAGPTVPISALLYKKLANVLDQLS